MKVLKGIMGVLAFLFLVWPDVVGVFLFGPETGEEIGGKLWIGAVALLIVIAMTEEFTTRRVNRYWASRLKALETERDRLRQQLAENKETRSS